MASRSERLLALIQALRRHRRPVTARQLATELSVSVRTIYRDIETLVAQGASIAGEAGVGFVMRPGFMLPPLMFRDEEIEALILGSRWVAQLPDAPLARAAADAVAKITAVLPDRLRHRVEDATFRRAADGGGPRSHRRQHRPRGDPRGAQAAHRVPERRRPEDRASHLADRHRLL